MLYYRQNSRCHDQNQSPKRNDLSFLKEENDLEVERRAGGKLFHARGPATANARSQIDARRVYGTTRFEVDADCGWRRAVLPTDTVRSDKYPGAVPFRQPYTSTHSLYWIRSGIRSQCKSIAASHGRICGHLP